MATREPEPMGAPPFADIPDPVAPFDAGSLPAPALPATRSPTRPERRRRAALAVALALAWSAIIVATLGLRPDLATPTVLLQLGSWTIVGALALVASLRPGERGLPPALRVVQVAVAVVPFTFAVVAMLWSNGTQPTAPSHGATVCMMFGVLIALGPLALAAATFQRAFLNAPAWRGAAIGAACGLAGAIGIHAHCPMGAMDHVLLAHGLPIVAGAIAGAVLGWYRGRI